MPQKFPHFVTFRSNQTKSTEHSEPQLLMQAVHDALAAQRRALEAIMQDSLTCWRDTLSSDEVGDFVEMVMTSWQEASTEEGARIPLIRMKAEIRNAVEDKLQHSDAPMSKLKGFMETVNTLWTQSDAHAQQSTPTKLWSDVDYVVESITKKRGDILQESPSMSGPGPSFGKEMQDMAGFEESTTVADKQHVANLKKWWKQRIDTGRFRPGDVLKHKKRKCTITAEFEVQDQTTARIFPNPVSWALNGREIMLRSITLAGTWRTITHKDKRHKQDAPERVLTLACSRKMFDATQLLLSSAGAGSKRRASADDLQIERSSDKARQISRQGTGDNRRTRAETPPTPKPDGTVVIIIRSDSEETKYRIKTSKFIKKYLDIHNNQHPLPSNQAWIYYVGPKAIVETDTAESLGLKEMDVVEARAYIV